MILIMIISAVELFFAIHIGLSLFELLFDGVNLYIAAPVIALFFVLALRYDIREIVKTATGKFALRIAKDEDERLQWIEMREIRPSAYFILGSAVISQIGVTQMVFLLMGNEYTLDALGYIISIAIGYFFWLGVSGMMEDKIGTAIDYYYNMGNSDDEEVSKIAKKIKNLIDDKKKEIILAVEGE